MKERSVADISVSSLRYVEFVGGKSYVGAVSQEKDGILVKDAVQYQFDNMYDCAIDYILKYYNDELVQKASLGPGAIVNVSSLTEKQTIHFNNALDKATYAEDRWEGHAKAESFKRVIRMKPE